LGYTNIATGGPGARCFFSGLQAPGSRLQAPGSGLWALGSGSAQYE